MTVQSFSTEMLFDLSKHYVYIKFCTFVQILRHQILVPTKMVTMKVLHKCSYVVHIIIIVIPADRFFGTILQPTPPCAKKQLTDVLPALHYYFCNYYVLSV